MSSTTTTTTTTAITETTTTSAIDASTAHPKGPPGQPDISYTPNHANYISRSKRRLANETLSETLPAGFPAQLHSPLVWTGEGIARDYQWVYELSDSDLHEVSVALAAFKASGMAMGEISRETFALPRLGVKLRDVSRELHRGHGFKVLRGIPVDRHTREENVIIYAGLAAHVAPTRGRQDHLWEGKPADVVLAHIKDLTMTEEAGKIGSPAYTAEKQVFHTDAGDVIALFCLSEAAEGGQSYLASSWHVYNEIAAERPDLIGTLAEDWAVDEFGKVDKGYSLRPLLYYQPSTDSSSEHMIIQYARRSFTGYWGLPRSYDVPAITEAQAEALDTLHFMAEKHAVALDFQKGDVQFVNNLSIFHARGGFRDQPGRERHLVRLWLRDPEHAWETPQQLKERWARVYDGVRSENQVFPLEPVIRNASLGEKVSS